MLNAPVDVWIGGSFTTQRLNPNDIDFVIFVDTQVGQQHSEAIRQFRAKRQTKNVLTDGYFSETVPIDHRDYRIYQFNRTDWFRDFGFDRRGNHKGILQLFFAKDERAIPGVPAAC